MTKKADLNISSFTKHMFIRQYLPALTSALVFSVADMADALVVGNRMGTLGLAAIALSLPVFMVFNLIMHSMGLGGSIIFAGKMSKGKEKEAKASFQGVISTLLILGIIIAALGNIFLDGILILLGGTRDNPELFKAAGIYLRLVLTAAPLFFFDYAMGYYMRNDDLEKEASICSAIGNISDFALNIILVLILNMGVMGAGVATLTGVSISSFFQIVFLRFRKSHLNFFPYIPDFKIVSICFKAGAASCISYIYSFVFIWLGNNAMMKLAGEAGVAIFDVVQNIGNFMIYMFGAITQASQPIISTYEGECNYDECDRLQGVLRVITVITSAVLVLLCTLLSKGILMLFGISGDESLAFGSYALRVFSVCILFAGLNIICSNYYSSRNIPFPAFLLSTLRGVAVIIPVLIVCILLGKYAFWFTYPVTEFLSFVIINIYLMFLKKDSKRVPKERIYTTMLGGDVSYIGKAVSELEEFCDRWEANPKQAYYVQMTVEEMCSAIITNGFTEKDRDQCNIQLTLIAKEGNTFSFHVRDNAVTFNPFGMNKKKLDEMEDADSDFNALGMDIIKKKASSFYYRRYQGFNTMVVEL